MRRVIKKERVCVEEPGSALPVGGVARRAHRAPGVKLVRFGGRVQSIELTCRCGEISVLELEYDDNESPSEVTQ